MDRKLRRLDVKKCTYEPGKPANLKRNDPENVSLIQRDVKRAKGTRIFELEVSCFYESYRYPSIRFESSV